MTAANTVTPPASGFVHFIAANPAMIRVVTAILSFIFLGVTIYTGSKLFVKSATEKESKETDPLKKLQEKEKEPTVTVDPLQKGKYRVPFVFAGLLMLMKFGLLFWHSTRQRGANGNLTDTDARTYILLFGGSVGFILALFGLTEFISSRDGLQKWLYEGNRKEGRYSIIALLILFAGLVSMFVAILPARTEVRSSSILRRLVFGYNSVLTGFLCFLLLAILNVGSFLKLPGKIDTTENQFYTLSETSKKYLAAVEQPINVYLLMSTRAEPLYKDVRNLLTRCEELAPKFFKTTEISPSSQDQVEAFVDKFKLRQQGSLSEGMLVAVGADEANFTFIRANELIDAISSPGSQQRMPIFQGESKLITELTFLTEGKQKSVLYFTQGHGELSIDPTERDPSKSAGELKKYLEDRKFEVKPLVIELNKKPKIDDAAMIIVLGPTQSFRPDELAVLEGFLKPADIGKKTEGSGGKLIAFLPPFADKETGLPGNTGLEGLLARFDIQPAPDYFLGLYPRSGSYSGSTSIFGMPSQPFMRASGRLTSLLEQHELYVFNKVREIRAGELTEGRPGAIQWAPLLINFGYNGGFVWREKNFDINISKVVEQIQESEEMQKAKELSRGGRPIAMLGSEGGAPTAEGTPGMKPRFAIFGTSDFLSDSTLQRGRSERTKSLELTAGIVDWLRERPTNIGIAPKEYRIYEMSPNASFTNLVWIPMAAVIFAVVGIGLGVWLARRR
jgi:hypothetical protein